MPAKPGCRRHSSEIRGAAILPANDTNHSSCLSYQLERKTRDWDVKGCVMVVVARDGIEPPTPAFSGPRSTTELSGLS